MWKVVFIPSKTYTLHSHYHSATHMLLKIYDDLTWGISKCQTISQLISIDLDLNRKYCMSASFWCHLGRVWWWLKCFVNVVCNLSVFCLYVYARHAVHHFTHIDSTFCSVLWLGYVPWVLYIAVVGNHMAIGVFRP